MAKVMKDDWEAVYTNMKMNLEAAELENRRLRSLLATTIRERNELRGEVKGLRYALECVGKVVKDSEEAQDAESDECE